MDITSLERTADLTSLVGHPLQRRGMYSTGPCPFCGGTDRFVVKHTADGDLWLCRQCVGDQKYHSVIEFIMRRDRVPFKTALHTLGSPAYSVRPVPAGGTAVARGKTLPSAAWQADALREVSAAADLLTQPQGCVARAWLSARGLSVSTWEAWLFGFLVYSPPAKPQTRIPVISLPWYEWDADGEVITAVKYRIMQGGSKLRYFSRVGSKFDAPFGLAYLRAADPILLLVEGELNCVSVWQCQPAGVSVLSFGSEGSGDPFMLQAVAGRYPNVFVWADDVWDNPAQKARSQQLRSLLAGRGRALRSVTQQQVKQDANQLLQDGVLPDFLAHVLGGTN